MFSLLTVIGSTGFSLGAEQTKLAERLDFAEFKCDIWANTDTTKGIDYKLFRARSGMAITFFLDIHLNMNKLPLLQSIVFSDLRVTYIN